MDVHTTSTTDITDRLSWRDRAFFKNMEALRPWMSYLMMAIMAVFMIYQSQRDTNAQNTVTNVELAKGQQSIKDEMASRKQFVDQQLTEIRANLVTSKEFQAWKDAVNQRMDWQDRMLTQILEHQVR